MPEDLAAWAWARHHNVLSWYIRPLFLLPFCWFAYRRSPAGIAATLLALATSMAWFPAPATVSPAVAAMLQAERDYLLGEWNVAKVAVALLVPLSLGTLAAAFWRRSLVWGLVVVNAMVGVKITWTFVFAPAEGALAHLVPALAGLVVCNLVLLAAMRRLRGR